MSSEYQLICMDNGECYSLGQLAIAWNAGREYYFGSVGLGGMAWDEASTRTLVGLHHFLVRNRGRELRLLPRTIYERHHTNHFPANDYSTVVPLNQSDLALVLAQPVGDPGPEQDVAYVPQKVLDRLRELSRGENIEKLPWDEPDLKKG